MRIKKILKRAAIIISVLLLIFKGILMYRDYASYKDVIHINANNIVKIRVDGLTQSVVFNAILNPSFYSNTSTTKDTIKEDEKIKKGFSIPANIFLYTIKSKPLTTIFTSFKISDKEDFKNNIKTKYKIDNFKESETFTTAKSKDEKVVVAFNDKQCVVAFNPTKESINDVFADLLVNNKTLISSDEKWDKIKHADSHISYTSKNDNLNIDFKSGKALISGNYLLPVFLDTPKTFKASSFSSDASVTLDLNLFSTIKYITLDHKDFKIETDSLYAYYDGHLALEIAKATSQIDSIISYEYNDDFEKVETLSAVKKEVPEINMQLFSNAPKLYNYLESISIIKQGLINKDLFPLYQVKVDTVNANNLLASTNLDNKIEITTTETSEVFALNIDFEKLQQQNHFPMINSYLEKLSNLKIMGSNDKNTTTQVEGQILLKNRDINALVQFFINQKE